MGPVTKLIFGLLLCSLGIGLWFRSSPKPGDSVRVPWSQRKTRELGDSGPQLLMGLIGGGLILIAMALEEFAR